MLDHERDGAALDGLGRELVPVHLPAADAEEERSRRDGARVVRQVGDLDRRRIEHAGRGERFADAPDFHAF